MVGMAAEAVMMVQDVMKGIDTFRLVPWCYRTESILKIRSLAKFKLTDMDWLGEMTRTAYRPKVPGFCRPTPLEFFWKMGTWTVWRGVRLVAATTTR